MEQQLIIWFMSSKLGSFISEHHNHRTWMYRCVQYKWAIITRGTTCHIAEKTFEGENLSFCGYSRKLAPRNSRGMVSSWHQRTTRESFLHNFFFFPPIHKSFLHEKIFHQFAKVFSLKCFPLYSTAWVVFVAQWLKCWTMDQGSKILASQAVEMYFSSRVHSSLLQNFHFVHQKIL